MESPSAKTHSYRFGPFRLEPLERRLLRDDRPVALTPKAFDLLLVLVENPGRLLEKDALLKRVWADAFVEEANLANNISLLRKGLGDRTDGTEYIETVPRRGYRFMAEVTMSEDSNEGQQPRAIDESGRLSDLPSPKRRSAITLASTRRGQSVLALAVLTVVAAVAVTMRRGHPVESNSGVVRFRVDAPSASSFPLSPEPFFPAISADGKRLVFRVLREGQPLLAIRSIDALNADILAGTERATFPFWSPDNRVVAFFAGGKLKRINASGGPIQTICDAAPGFGGTWNRDGVILFAPSATEGLFKVPAAGGRPTPVTSLQKDETFHQHPQFLPDGRRFLYFAAPDGVYLGSLDGGTPVRILTNSRMALYSPSAHILFMENRTLFAQRIDVDRARLFDDRVPLGDDVRIGGVNVGGRAVGGAAFSVSENGVLVYGTDPPIHPRLAWLDRAGRVVGSVGPFPFERFTDSELSPDGNQIAVANSTQAYAEDVWLFDLANGQSTQLTFNAAADRRPIWSPDGRRLAFMSGRPEAPGIYQKLVTGEQPEELLVRSNVSRPAWPSDWPSRGLVYEIQGGGIWILPRDGQGKSSPLVREPVSQPDAKFSPHGKWLAYTSDESGRPEVFVRSVVTDAQWRISTDGGSLPRWSRDGKELFYLAADGKLMAVSLGSDAGGFRPGVPRSLFQTELNTMPAPLRALGVGPDGQRFLISVVDDPSATPSLVVVSNWQVAFTR